MEIEIGPEWTTANYQIEYHSSQHSFLATPQPSGGIASILFNDLQLEIDDSGLVLYVWGLFPHLSRCMATDFMAPVAEKRLLRFSGIEEITPGVSVRYNSVPWDCFVNMRSGWVGVGNPKAVEESLAIEFGPNQIAVIDNGKIVTVWLRSSCHS